MTKFRKIVAKIGEAWKAVAATCTTLVALITFVLANEDLQRILPDSVETWLAGTALVALTFAATFLTKNYPPVEKAQKILEEALRRVEEGKQPK